MLFVSRWDKAVSDKVPRVATDSARACADIARIAALASSRWELAQATHAQRLLWASTGTKDPNASDTLYIEALAASDTINTMPEKTLLAFADHGKIGNLLPEDGGDAESEIGRFRGFGIDIEALAVQLQQDGAKQFEKSWNELMRRIAEKSNALATAA